MISGNFSGFTNPGPCGGYDRTHWKLQAEQNPPPNPDWTKESFAGIFGTAYVKYGKTASSSPDKLGKVFLDSFSDSDGLAVPGFASYIIAAYLNASPSYGNVGSVQNVLTTGAVIDMWNDIVVTKEYCPQLLMCWDATSVIDYLRFSGIVSDPLP
jgi:hypothetical protein